ncbi:MAG: hypothetical protein H6707_09735 [Deltaproteobacteria bacterium]|nr:hypothetical protein [Deltaproteobacteria bacterium]
MRFCPFCAQEMVDDAVDCAYCGKPLPQAAAAAPPVGRETQRGFEDAPQAPTPPRAPSPRAPGGAKKTVLGYSPGGLPGLSGLASPPPPPATPGRAPLAEPSYRRDDTVPTPPPEMVAPPDIDEPHSSSRRANTLLGGMAAPTTPTLPPTIPPASARPIPPTTAQAASPLDTLATEVDLSISESVAMPAQRTSHLPGEAPTALPVIPPSLAELGIEPMPRDGPPGFFGGVPYFFSVLGARMRYRRATAQLRKAAVLQRDAHKAALAALGRAGRERGVGLEQSPEQAQALDQLASQLAELDRQQQQAEATLEQATVAHEALVAERLQQIATAIDQLNAARRSLLAALKSTEQPVDETQREALKQRMVERRRAVQELRQGIELSKRGVAVRKRELAGLKRTQLIERRRLTQAESELLQALGLRLVELAPTALSLQLEGVRENSQALETIERQLAYLEGEDKSYDPIGFKNGLIVCAVAGGLLLAGLTVGLLLLLL